MYKIITYIIFVFLFVASISFANILKEHNYILETTNIFMQDGIKLVTDIYRPKKLGKYPCVLARTPYNRQGHIEMIESFISQNLVVVIQDCRGTFDSDGEFFPFINERKDGLQTVEWIRKQNWTNGKIAGYAGSYNGYTQLAISDVIDFTVPDVTCADIREIIYPYGIFSPKTTYSWGFMMDGFSTREKIKESYKILPLSDASFKTYKKTNTFIDVWLKHENYDDFWKKQNHQRIAKGPMLSIAGWYDMFIGPQIDDFMKLDENVRARSRMVVGPWWHGTQGIKKEYGGEKKTGNRNKLIHQYIIAKLKNEKVDKIFVGPYTNTKYNFFILEKNEYVGSETWPPAKTKLTKFYFGKGKLLSEKVPKKNGVLNFVYNPENPCKSLGGAIFGDEVGPADQSANTSRTDQLVFEMEIKETPLTLLGPIKAQLFVKTDVKSTDFFVCIQDVFPKGPIINIQKGGAKFLPQNKNKPQKLNIKIWPTGYQIKPGHKLRIVINSSQFPAYNRSLNTGEAIYSAKKMKKANQKIYLGKSYPSSVTLPIYFENSL